MMLALLIMFAAAESDPYYAWRSPARDSTVAMDRAINARLAIGLRAAHGSCRDAAAAMTAPLASTAQYFFIGPVRRWGLDTVPRAGDAAFESKSVYRDAPLSPFGHAVPLDPTTSAGGVSFGTDKLGHFFTNGLRSFDRYTAARARGADEAAAMRDAILLGVEEEKGWLGLGVCGIFSYADIHANMSGLRFFRALCEGGELARVDGRWQLAAPFRISRWVDPCWDESFSPSAFAATEAPALAEALAEVCPLLRTPRVRDARARYRVRGCDSDVEAELGRLIAAGHTPDPTPWAIELVCARPDEAALEK